MSAPYRTIQAEELRGIGDPVVVCTFMRSGTHLTIDLMRRQFAAFRSWKRPLESLDSLYFPVDVLLPGEPDDWNAKRALAVLRRPARPILKSHFLAPDLANLRERQPAVADWLESRATFLHVTRDVRQVLRSLWAYLPEEEGKATPFDEDFVRTWGVKAHDHARRWMSRPGVRSLSFADITAQPESVVRQMADWFAETPLWERPLLPAPLKSRTRSRLARLFRRDSESTAILNCREAPPWNPSWDHLLSL